MMTCRGEKEKRKQRNTSEHLSFTSLVALTGWDELASHFRCVMEFHESPT